MVTRDDVVRVARSYLGTPFQHRGRTPGQGLDCAGLVICVAKELGLVAPDFDVPPYRMSARGDEMLRWCDRYMQRIEREAMGAADVIVLATERDPQHLGILADYRHGGLSIIHASNSPSVSPQRVIETRLMFARGMQYRAAYRLPGVQ